MGCLSLHFLKACSVGSSKIKVMTVHGSCLKFEAPAIVKEVLMDYPLHSLFDSVAVRTLGSRARPLRSTLSLRPGHLYFLVPQSTVRSAHSTCTTAPCSSSSSDCPYTALVPEISGSNRMHTAPNATLSQVPDLPRMQVSDASSQTKDAHMQATECSSRKRKVSFAMTPAGASRESAKPCVQFLPSPSDSVVRVKMVVSKRQLASVLKGGGDCVSMVEGLLSPLLEASRKDAASSVCNDASGSLSWRPSLESIPESL